MLSRIASRITISRTPMRSFVAIWPPIKGSKVVKSLEEVTRIEDTKF